MKCILLEFVDEAETLLNHFGEEFFRDKNTLVISLHPKVKAFLKRKNISCEDTISYFDNDAQHRVILKSEELAVKISENINIVDQFGIKKGYEETLIHHTRLYLNYFLWIIEILNNIHKKHDIKSVIACGPTDHLSYTDEGYLQDEERFLGAIAKEFCGVHKKQFKETTLDKSKNTTIGRSKKLLVRLIATIISRVDYALIPKKRSDESRIIVPGLSYRMDSLLQEIKSRGQHVNCYMLWEGGNHLKQHIYKVYLIVMNYWKKIKKQQVVQNFIHLDLLKGKYPYDLQERRKLERAFDQLFENIENGLINDFIYEGVSTYPYLKGKIQNGLKRTFIELQHSTYVLHKIFTHLKLDLHISMYSSGIYYNMGEMANYLNIPALNISHGTHVPPNNKYEEIENYRASASVISNTFPYVAVQTPWTDKFLDYYNDSRKRLLTGPLLFSVVDKQDREAVRKEMLNGQSQAKIMVYASTQKPRHGFRFHITETLDEFIVTLSDIINCVNAINNLYLILRPHPVCDLTEEEFRELLPKSEKVFFIQKGPFSRILSAADVLVSFSSTCIEEAIQNNIPVILYDKWRRYNHFNLKEVNECKMVQPNETPVHYVTKDRLLKPVVERILNFSDNQVLNKTHFAEYRFPEGYRENFFKFVSQVI